MTFIPGLELNRNFFHQAVKPLIQNRFPGLPFSAGLLGYGSDVLGFDDPTSMDHNWGPRCLIFLNPEHRSLIPDLKQVLSFHLPLEFEGFPTNFSDPRFDFTQKMVRKTEYPINHLVEVFVLEDYFTEQLKVADLSVLSDRTFLSFQDQILLELTSGEVFHDGLGRLRDLRRRLSAYPSDVEKLKLAALWEAVGNEEPFVSRCVSRGDLLGARLVATRIVTTYGKILCAVEKHFVPYSKWLGARLKNLPSFSTVKDLLEAVLAAADGPSLETALCSLGLAVVEAQNARGDLPRVSLEIQSFYGRPGQVIFASQVAHALRESVTDPDLKTLPSHSFALDRLVDGVDFTE